MEQKLSVIICAYNQENVIERAVRSALSQSFKNIEVTAVDDGSQDNTLSVLTRLSEEDSRLKVITKKNGGVSAARNDALRACSGDKIITLDGDDYFEDGIFEAFMKEAQAYPHASLIQGGMYYEYPGKKVLYEPDTEFYGTTGEFLDGPFLSLYENHLLTTHCNKLYDAGIIRESGLLFDEELKINEDIDFVFRYLKLCENVRVIKAPCISYVQHDAGASQITTYRENGISSALKVMREGTELTEKARLPMLIHVLSFVGVMYKSSGCSREKKFAELRKLCSDRDFQWLLREVKPDCLKTRAAVFLLKNGFLRSYHLMCLGFYR